jgi:hypothetical protein
MLIVLKGEIFPVQKLLSYKATPSAMQNWPLKKGGFS